MPKYLIINIGLPVVFLLSHLICFGGSDLQQPQGGRGNAMGNASVALTDFWALQNNQAGLAGYSSLAGSFYYQNSYLVKELGLRSGGFVFPTNTGVFGLSYQYFGYTQYNESKIGLAYAKSLGNGFAAAVQLDYIAYKLSGDYGHNSIFTFEIGIQKKLSEKIVIGAHAFNPIRAKLTDDPEERVPAIYRLGITYSVSNDLILVLETEKDLDYKPLVRGGLEYRIAKMAFARLGYSSVPALTGSENLSVSSMYTFGFGLKFGQLDVDFAASMNQTLGWSPAISMVYHFNKSK